MNLLLLLGCGSEITYHQDVKPLLEARCLNCHTEGNIGGIDLSSVDTVQEWGRAIAHVTENRSMPPWSGVGDFSNDWSLSDDQIAMVQQWVDADMPLGDAEGDTAPVEMVGTTLSRVDASLSMSESYVVATDSGDEYRCFVLDWEEVGTQYITGFNAIPGNSEMVHHIAAFLVRPDGLLGDSIFDSIQEWEQNDDRQGYSCYGGPSLTGSSSQIPIEQIAQWVPGNQGMDFPEGTGISIEEGSKIILQLHYNVRPEQVDKSDQTRLEFSLADSVTAPAAYAPWLNGTWPVAGMSIPAGATGVVHTVEADPRGFFNVLNPTLELEDGFDIHGLMMHMHRLGRSGEVVLVKSDGTEIPLLNIPAWDFDWQFTYLLREPVRFDDGDALRLTCVFDNNAPDAVNVDWGEGTLDEMCVGNLYISTL